MATLAKAPAARAAERARTDDNTLAVLGLLLLSFVPYLNALLDDFVYDDRLQIIGNPYVHSFRYLRNIFGSTVWTFQGAQGISNYYRPMMTVAYLLCYRIGGLIPFGYHLLNVALNAAVVLLLFKVTEILFEDRQLALISAGLFALHPMHTESVTWVAGIPDTELGVFLLLTFLCYLGLEKSEMNGFAWRQRALMLGCYVLALLSKEQAMVVPAILTVYEHFYRRDRQATTWLTKLTRYLPLWVMAAVYICFRQFALGSFAPAMSRPNLPLTSVLITAVSMVGGYLWKLIWPVHFSIFYVFREVNHVSDPRFLAGVAGLLICLGIFVYLWRRDHAMSFSLIWMGATLGPVLNARWMPAGVFAERYLYLPCAGFCWLVAWAALKLWRRAAAVEKAAPGMWHRALSAAVPVGLAVLAVFYGVRTFERNRDWSNENTIYRLTLAVEPDAQLIRTNLGVLLWAMGNRAEAEKEWTLAAAGPHPAYAATLGNLGLARMADNRYPEAERFFWRALALGIRNSEPHMELGTIYAREGRLAEAEGQYHEAARLAPLNTDLLNAYGHFLLGQGRLADAQKIFEQSVQADDNSDAEENLGDICLARGELACAGDAYRASLKIYPFETKAHFGLAVVEERTGRTSEALAQAQAGLETDIHNVYGLEMVKRLQSAAASSR